MGPKVVKMCKIGMQKMKIPEKIAHNLRSLRFPQLRTTLSFTLGVVLAALIPAPQSLAAQTYLQFAKSIVANLPADSQFREDLESQLVAEANSFRGRKRVKPLEASGQLRMAARAHATDMMLNNFVGHRSSKGQQFDARMSAFLGAPLMLPKMAENAARDTQKGEADAGKASRLFQQWVDSAPHRKALLNSGYRFVSTGVVQRGNKIYAVQIFFNQIPKEIKVFGSERGAGRALLSPPVAVWFRCSARLPLGGARAHFCAMFFTAFCTLLKADTSIWRMRSRETPYSCDRSSSVTGSSRRRRASKICRSRSLSLSKRLGQQVAAHGVFLVLDEDVFLAVAVVDQPVLPFAFGIGR